MIVEDLNLKGLMKNRKVARGFADAGIGEFFSMLRYKLERLGRYLVKVDRWFPSSKQCSCCNRVFKELTMDVREWQCLHCHTVHDRDFNAANNLMTEGLGMLNLVLTPNGVASCLDSTDMHYASGGAKVKSMEPV